MIPNCNIDFSPIEEAIEADDFLPSLIEVETSSQNEGTNLDETIPLIDTIGTFWVIDHKILIIFTELAILACSMLVNFIHFEIGKDFISVDTIIFDYWLLLLYVTLIILLSLRHLSNFGGTWRSWIRSHKLLLVLAIIEVTIIVVVIGVFYSYYYYLDQNHVNLKLMFIVIVLFLFLNIFLSFRLNRHELNIAVFNGIFLVMAMVVAPLFMYLINAS